MNPTNIIAVQQTKPETVEILNIAIDNISKIEVLRKLKQGGIVFTPNVDHIIKLQKDRDFYQIYQKANYRLCDSQMLMIASRFLGTPIQEKISGSDLFPAFYRYYAKDKSVKIFLLGGPKGAAQTAQKNINDLVGREMVVDYYCPPFGFENNAAECRKIVDKINNSGATVLAVGLGAPKQEKWIYEYKNSLKGIKTFFAIGATIEFEAGFIPRAPQWMSIAGIEWLYRLIQEPRRLWKRYLIEDTSFFFLILLQKFNLYSENNNRLEDE